MFIHLFLKKISNNSIYLITCTGVGAHQVINLIDGTLSPTCPRPHLQTHSKKSRQRRASGRSASVSGMVKRTRSIQINPGEAAGKPSVTDKSVTLIG